MCDKPQIGDECLFYDNPNDSSKCTRTLITTTSDGRFVDNCSIVWKYCEKARKKITVVKKASEIIKWCEEHGYRWENQGYMDPQNKHNLWYGCLQDCGKEAINKSYWHEDWLEEKEL